MAAETRLFLCLTDNYGVLLHDTETGATAAIDAPEAAPVEKALQQTGWKLTDILVTHHHHDHTGGIAALKAKHKCRVVAPARSKNIPGVDETVHEGDEVKVGNLIAKVIETPGHTLDHITYWFPKNHLAFVGDTLFSIGCGRVIEGTPHMMWQSLKKLRDLPNETLVYCGHEYTAANVKFALTVDANNPVLEARAVQVRQQISEGEPTIPVSIGDEKLENPFLRADVPDLAVDIGMAGRPPEEVFAEIRGRKDRF